MNWKMKCRRNRKRLIRTKKRMETLKEVRVKENLMENIIHWWNPKENERFSYTVQDL
jgi:hypothetical protein